MINAQRWLHENHGNLYQISSIVESGQTGLWYCQIVHFHAITKPHPKETNTNCKLQYVVIIVVVVAKNVRISMFSARTSYVNLYSYKFSSIIHSTSYNSVRFNDEFTFGPTNDTAPHLFTDTQKHREAKPLKFVYDVRIFIFVKGRAVNRETRKQVLGFACFLSVRHSFVLNYRLDECQ